MWGGPAGMMAMMGRRDSAALAQAQPFDKAFIEQMVPYHQMAVMLSAMTLPGAQRPELIALLRSIVAGQSAEIRQMRAWYGAWYGWSVPTRTEAIGGPATSTSGGRRPLTGR